MRTFHIGFLLMMLFCNTGDVIISTQNQDNLTQFIPKGFKLLNEYTSDLNNDSRPDKLILITDTVTQSESLIILIRLANNSLEKATQNDNIGSPEIVAGKGIFTIKYFNHGGGEQCNRDITFEYSTMNKDWFVQKETLYCTSDTPTNSGGYDSTTVKTTTVKDFGEIWFKNYKNNQ